MINITSEEHKHHFVVHGSRSYFKEYVGGKNDDWVNQVTKLAEITVSQPQEATQHLAYDTGGCIFYEHFQRSPTC